MGRSASNDLILDHPEVANLQFVIGVRADKHILKNRAPQLPLSVNGKVLEDCCRLREGDVIALGSLELELVDPKKDAAALQPVPTEWSLKSNNPVMGARVFPLGETTLVGRSPDCDLQFAAAHLSRRHAQLQIVDGLLFVKDLGSSNGTYLNGEKVTETRVRRGDELRFDTLSFGVLGPVDDLGKTTVRRNHPDRTSAPSARAPTAEAVRRATPTPPEPVLARPQDNEEPSALRPKRWVGGLLLVGLAIGVAAVWLFKN